MSYKGNFIEIPVFYQRFLLWGPLFFFLGTLFTQMFFYQLRITHSFDLSPKTAPTDQYSKKCTRKTFKPPPFALVLKYVSSNSIIPKPVQKGLAKIVWDITILLLQTVVTRAYFLVVFQPSPQFYPCSGSSSSFSNFLCAMTLNDKTLKLSLNQ